MKRLEKISVLTAKLKKAVAEEGIGGLAGRTKGYLARAKKEKEFQREKSRVYRDILFISGCNEQLPHPHRYRVVHQMEQLEAGGYTCDTVYFQELKPWMVRCYGAFVIFRCPMTDTLREFATMAKQMNKPLWYDVDDLVIDTKYTDQIPFLDRMQPEERQAYDQNVRNMGELLSLCDAAVTTTAALAEELKQYVPEVLINRNCASDEMLLLSEAVLKEKQKKNEADGTAKKVRLGYFSGSATHLDDIEMIVPVLKQLLGKNPNLELLIVGILELPVELKLFASQIQMEGFVDYQKLPERIASVDINLAPLTDTIFNRAKSENKWVANTPTRLFPPSRGGRTIGDQVSRTASENSQINQRWEYSSSPLSAFASRNSGSKTIVLFSSSISPLCLGIPNFSGKSVWIRAITFIAISSATFLTPFLSCIFSSISHGSESLPYVLS